MRALLDAGRPVVAPAYGDRGTRPVAESFGELRVALAEVIDASPSGRLDIVGHSLGGYLALRLAHHFPAGTVGTVVGLGAAFRGIPYTGPDWYRRLIGVVSGPVLLEILRPEPWPAEVPAGTRVVSVYSRTDAVVPFRSSRLGEQISVPGIRHELLPQQTDLILRALGQRPHRLARPDPAGPGAAPASAAG